MHHNFIQIMSILYLIHFGIDHLVVKSYNALLDNLNILLMISIYHLPREDAGGLSREYFLRIPSMS